MSGADKDWLEALERAVQEVEALQAIYPDDDEMSAAIRLFVKSPAKVDAAMLLVESEEAKIIALLYMIWL